MPVRVHGRRMSQRAWQLGPGVRCKKARLTQSVKQLGLEPLEEHRHRERELQDGHLALALGVDLPVYLGA